MARSRMPKFDASEVITNEVIRIIERGVLPWRKPWTAGGGSRPLRVGGEPYQGVNNFLLTMRTVMAGHSSPFWMTLPQANALDAKVRKGVKQYPTGSRRLETKEWKVKLKRRGSLPYLYGCSLCLSVEAEQPGSPFEVAALKVSGI